MKFAIGGIYERQYDTLQDFTGLYVVPKNAWTSTLFLLR
jgi:hypothetical protein